MTRTRIVATGATGFIGRSLLARLARAEPGWEIVVPTRRPYAARSLGPLPNVTMVQADVHDPAAMRGLLDGAHALVHLVAVLHGDAARFDRVHVALPRQLAATAALAGVSRVVHVSALAVAEDAPSLYLRSKWAGEQAWLSSGLSVTVLRPSVVFGAEDRFTNLFGALQRVLPVLPLAGSGARFQPVWVEDVAEAALRALRAPSPLPAIVECAGPEVLTLAEIARRSGRRMGCERPVVPLPEWAGMAQAALMRWLPGEPPLSADNLRSMRVASVASGQWPGLRQIGIEPEPLALLDRSTLGQPGRTP